MVPAAITVMCLGTEDVAFFPYRNGRHAKQKEGRGAVCQGLASLLSDLSHL